MDDLLSTIRGKRGAFGARQLPLPAELDNTGMISFENRRMLWLVDSPP